MAEEEEVLDLGPRRRPGALRFLVVLGLVAAVGGYLVVRDQDDDPASLHTAPTRALSTAPPTIVPPPDLTADRPPWPRRAGACGGTSFLPLVSSRPLSGRTGIRAVVGDRLATVDVDTGAVHAAAGLPPGRYASEVASTAQGTYALLRPCGAQLVGAEARLVRLDRHGAVRAIARGPYDYLLSGGNHPWAVVSTESADRAWLDPLDGSRRRLLPAGFAPVGAQADVIVGTVSRPGTEPDPSFVIGVYDPRGGEIRLLAGPATSVALSHGLLLWTGLGCTSACRLHVHDLATGRDTTTRRPVHGIASAWAAAVSANGRTAALVRPRSKPAKYDMEHPGNPNEIVTVDLVSGRSRPVPDLAMWSKSSPGLAFSADSRWLLISLDEGSGVRLLLWKPGLAQPLESPARLTARVAYSPTITTF